MAYLQALNPAQLRAVQHPPNIPLQILAGPGSGKTKVLTSRIAHLIAHHNLHPSSICAVTFTNKAANEMRERLKKLLGNDRTADIRMGTFHALCAMFLRRHAGLVGLEGNFTVCDADESKKIVTKLLKPYSEFLAERNITLKEGTVLSHISKAKAKGHTPEALLAQLVDSKHRMHGSKPCEADCVSHTIDGTVIAVYEEYEKTLRKNNSLDFDDLLVFGVKLFGEHASVVRWCRHVLVDEFQDTNIMQYDLMRYIATASRCVTIVGDPDQSIYGWRSAEIANLGKMQRDFPSTQQILLEQNYRSTASILAASIAIVAEDKMRVPKLLHTTHPQGPCPVLREFSSEKVEAAMIAAEVKRLVAYSGGMLGWGDFVVLLRFNALSRGIESALRLEGIPSRVLAGHKFFERLEVKDVLAYLQLIDNPRFVPAFTRVINVPGRSIGEKTVAELLSTAERMNISPLELAERIHDGKTPDIKPSVKRKLGPFIAPIRRLRTLANECMAPSNLIRQLLEQVNYEDHLKKTQPDWESRWDNVQELITFASEVECGSLLPTGGSSSNPEALPDVKSKAKTDETEVVSVEDTPLRLFLQASMLSTDTDTDSDRDAKEKVTISTCHAAKGLEWPVVMIPAVEKGTFPSQRADDIEEERRLLYVACTRAQGLLYLSHTASRMVAGMSMKKALSEFIAVVRRNNPVLFTDKIPGMDEDDRALLAAVLRRALPQPAEVACSIAEYNRLGGNDLLSSNRGESNQNVYVHQIGAPASRPAQVVPYPTQVPFQGSGAFSSTRSQGYAPYPNPGPFAGPSTYHFSTSSTPAVYPKRPPVYDQPHPRPLSPSRNRAANINAWPAAQVSMQINPFPGVAEITRSQNISLVMPSASSSASRADVSLIPQSASTKTTNAPVPSSRLAPLSSDSSGPAMGRGPTKTPSEWVLPLLPSPLSSTSSSSTPERVRTKGSTMSDPPSCSSIASDSQGDPNLESASAEAKPAVAGTKRRLGMGRSTTGYQNKKFKVPGA